VEFGDVVRKRRMVHVFEQRLVDRTLVDRLLDVARRAPSAGFSQGYDFLVLDEPASIARFWELTDDPRFPREPGEVDNGPTVIVLAYSDVSRYVERYSRPDKIAFGLDRAEAWPVPFWDTDTAMACQNLLLAAVDAGLGSWFFGVNHGRDDVAAEFGVPAGRQMIGIVGLGHEGEDEAPRGSAYSLQRRPFEEQVHHNRW
jgi:nitroreductase